MGRWLANQTRKHLIVWSERGLFWGRNTLKHVKRALFRSSEIPSGDITVLAGQRSLGDNSDTRYQ